MEINVGKLNELPEGSYQLIDMRSDRDFEYGTIPGAIHISQEDLQGNLAHRHGNRGFLPHRRYGGPGGNGKVVI